MSESRIHHPLIELTISRVKETIREPEAMFWVFVFPVLLALALGIAFRERPPDKIPIAVDRRMKDADRVAKMISKSAQLKALIVGPADLNQYLRVGKVALVISRSPEAVPLKSGKAENFPGGTGPEFFLIYDAARSESQLARLAVNDALQSGNGRMDVIALQDRLVKEPGSRYIDFLIPGLIAMNLMGSGMWGVGFGIVFARTRKLLKRLAASPMRRSHYLLAYMLSRLIFLVGEVAGLIGFAWLVFGVKVHGSLIELAILSVMGSMTFAGLGLLVAARATTIETVSGWMNFIMLPMYLLSGSFFPYSRFPTFLQPFIRALPLTALTDTMRAIINQGTPLFHNWLELLVMIAWGTISFSVALKIFRWQ